MDGTTDDITNATSRIELVDMSNFVLLLKASVNALKGLSKAHDRFADVA
jgi:hypothetical protein